MARLARDSAGRPNPTRGCPHRAALLPLLVSIALLPAGCITYNGKREVVPVFEIHEGRAHAGGVGKAATLGPQGEPPQTLEVIVRPLGSLEWIGDERSRLKLAWPLMSFAWGAGIKDFWVLPTFAYRERPAPRYDDTEIDFMLFPFIYAGHEPDPAKGNYVAIFPFFGSLRDVLAKDTTIFLLFPLYWHTWDEGVDSLHILWPFFNRVKGAGRSGWRIWPFYGFYDAVDARLNPRYHRTFVLWPFYIAQENRLNSLNPTELFFSFPLFGWSESPHYSTRTYLWPLFIRIDDRRLDETTYAGYVFPYRIGARQFDLWPFFGWKTREGRTETGRYDGLFAALGTDADDSSVEAASAGGATGVGSYFRQFALWPIQRYETETTPTSEGHRFWFLPFFWRFYSHRTSPEQIDSEWKIWPLYRFHRVNDEVSFYFPSPLWFRQESPFERLYARLWRLFLYESNEKRSGWEVLFGLFSHRYETREQSRTFSVLYGLLEWEIAPVGHRFRVLYLPWR